MHNAPHDRVAKRPSCRAYQKRMVFDTAGGASIPFIAAAGVGLAPGLPNLGFQAAYLAHQRVHPLAQEAHLGNDALGDPLRSLGGAALVWTIQHRTKVARYRSEQWGACLSLALPRSREGWPGCRSGQ